MKKYIFSVTNQSHLYDVAERLFDDKIAAPVLWIGDDSLYGPAKKKFGDVVFNDLIHRHRNYDIKEISYEKEHLEFFKSENYSRAKDIHMQILPGQYIYMQSFNKKRKYEPEGIMTDMGGQFFAMSYQV